eukprot:NODE_750_length_4219_cov_1.247330.p4 type:complete len:104 gc:universal NODE_750_length_4219_cov_1.247330:1355-1044(-)
MMLPIGKPRKSNTIFKYFPNLLELLFLKVLAFPNASSKGFVAKIMSFKCVIFVSFVFLIETSAMYCKILLALSVLPAPLSPLMIEHWFARNCIICLYIYSAIA